MPGLNRTELNSVGAMALAGYGWRVLGYVIDSIILAVVISLPLRVLDVNVYASAGVVAILTFAYGALTLTYMPGQTFGMKVARVRCVGAGTNTTIKSAQAIKRTALFWLLGLIGNLYHFTKYVHPTVHQSAIESRHQLMSLILVLPLYLDLLWPLWDKRNQTLSDKFADTVVVRPPS